MPFLSHIKELRGYLIRSIAAIAIAFCISFFFYASIVEFLSYPFQQFNSLGEKDLFIHSIFEGFIIKIKIMFLSAFTFTAPLHIFHIIRFIFPALHSHEKRVIFYTLFVSFLLIIFSVFFTYNKIIPISVAFLTGSGIIPDKVGLLLNYGDNVLFVFQFLLIAIALFQLPIILEILMAMDLVKRKFLLQHHRFVVVGILILCAILTPPDPISLLTLAFPLCFLFYLTLLIAKLAGFGDD